MHDVLALPGAACESLLRVCCQIESPDDGAVGLLRNGILIVECNVRTQLPSTIVTVNPPTSAAVGGSRRYPALNLQSATREEPSILPSGTPVGEP